MTPLGVLSVTSEIFPLVKTGGLADVTGALPGALAGEGIDVRSLVPGYPAVIGAIEDAHPVHRIADLFGGPARLLAARAGDLALLVLDAPHLYARPGNPYLGPDGRDWPDNAVRFAALAQVAADVGLGAVSGYVPDVVHAHDWQAGLAPVFLRDRARARGDERAQAAGNVRALARGTRGAQAWGNDRAQARGNDRAQARGNDRAQARGNDRAPARAGDPAEARGTGGAQPGRNELTQTRASDPAEKRGNDPAEAPGTRRARPGTVMTVHNLAFPGKVPASMLASLGLPPASYAVEGVEFFGTISYLKAGLYFADRLTTVSPTYAAEIQTTEGGMGFDGLLRARAGVLSGILNGIDTGIWDPAGDPLIAARFDRATLSSRPVNKATIQARMGLRQDPAAPLFGVVSRLTAQKGMDVLLACLPLLRSLGAQLAVLGTGEPDIETAFRAASASAPGEIGCVIGYDEALAHQMQAGIDALLVPSRFEPCGLTQLCALRYGAVPVVARVGGLADTVIDANPAALRAGVATGVQFAPVTVDTLGVALRRTVALYRDPAVWRGMQANGMAADVSWRSPARRYAALYRELAA